MKDIELKPNYKIASFDITNLYTNIPVQETINILEKQLVDANTLSPQQIKECVELLQVILKQNYFMFNNRYFIQEEGLAMGSPLSGLLSDIYLNHYENTYLLSDVNKLHTQIIFYARYVDDTFIVFNGTLRQIDNLRQYLNNINKHIQFTGETENNSRLNFLDLTVIKVNNGFKYQIYRKPTTTDITIHADSHHPNSQKIGCVQQFYP